jgi:MFS transporter, DHA1 family, tetracycline resistance protein
MIIGTVTLAAAMFTIVPLRTALWVTLLFAPLAFGQGVTQPSLQSLVTRFGVRQSGGQLLGLYQSSRSLALIFGPVWAGFAFESISPQSVLVVGGCLSLLATLFAILLFRRPVSVRTARPPEPKKDRQPLSRLASRVDSCLATGAKLAYTDEKSVTYFACAECAML